MPEENANDGMIEIGDPFEESAAVEPPPRVVIEYRERGVPWMVLPPILVICAVVAVTAYRKFAPVLVLESPRTQAVATVPRQPETLNPLPAVATPASSTPTQPQAPVEVAGWPVEKSAIPDPSTPILPVEPPKPVVELPVVAEPTPVAEKPAEPANSPSVTGVGFDAKALEAEKKAELPPTDPAIAPAARQDAPQEPARPVITDEKNLPVEMDPELLPPDPRMARVRDQQRAEEAVKQSELDRIRFHNDLREICRISRDDYIKEVIAVSNRYGMQASPKSKKAAAALLGKNGRFVGADRLLRIDVLRAVEFPEPLILEDIFDNYEKGRIGERNGPRNANEAMYRSILFLLRYAPGQPASPVRAANRPAQVPRPPSPAFSTGPNPR
jgi:hypothetical protein